MLALVIAAVAAVTVEGQSACPTAAQVSDVLATLLVDASAHGEPHRARLEERADGVQVELRSAGRSLGQRLFPRSGSCAELASAIAVVIATWEAAFAGDTPAIDIAARRRATAPPPASAPTVAVGGGVLAAADGAGWSAGGLGELAIGTTRSRWSARIAALVATRKRAPLAPGMVAWSRPALDIGARFRLAEAGPVAIDVIGDLVLGVLVASGNGFTVDRTAYSFEPGVASGARFGVGRGALGSFVEATGTLWLRDGHLEVSGVADTSDLPRYEARVIVGLTWRLAGP